MFNLAEPDTMSRKSKRNRSIGVKTTEENASYVAAKALVEGISGSDYVHRLITADRVKCENDFRILGNALGLKVNRVN